MMRGTWNNRKGRPHDGLRAARGPSLFRMPTGWNVSKAARRGNSTEMRHRYSLERHLAHASAGSVGKIGPLGLSLIVWFALGPRHGPPAWANPLGPSRF